MFLLRLIRQEIQSSLAKLLLMAVLAGISNALIIAMINAGGEAASKGEVNLRAAIVFILALLIYVRAQYYIMSTTTIEVEAAVHRLRVRLMDSVRNSELLSLESIGRAEIVAVITKETGTLTQAASVSILAAQGAVLIFFTGIYVAYQSLPAFLLSAAIVAFSALLFLGRNRKHKADLEAAQVSENQLFDRLGDMLSGFREVRLNRARSEDLLSDIEAASTKSAVLKIKSHVDGLSQLTFAQGAFFVLLGAIVFVVPTFSATLGGSMVKTTTALLFVIGAIGSVISAVPVLSVANSAAENVAKLEETLGALAQPTRSAVSEPATSFTTIEFQDVTFRYVDKQSERAFGVGPFNLVLHAGEIIFIAGGNGSGKSTFLNLLIGLYPPDSGRILIDGEVVRAANRDVYREKFAAVFSTYHLFKRLYGIADADPAEVKRLLALFQLAGKTQIIDGEFTTIDLSAGQRKRLALIVSLLEKRPILVLDEWTADQDPEFRRKFYEELVPALQQAGKTLVAVTHDDRYLSEFKLPARKLVMDEGRFATAPVERV